VLAGRNAVPNACILPLESRSDTTWRRYVLLARGVGHGAGIKGVLNGLGIIVPSRSRVVGIHLWLHRWVSGIMGVKQSISGVGEQT
jgi:hypothetical protein